MDKVIGKIRVCFSSKHFLGLILLVIGFQGLWYAFNFQPTILDEARHTGFIEMYSERLSPFIAEQDSEWDYLGDTTRDPSYFYYYTMSFPWRAVKSMSSDYKTQIILLRLVHIFIFALAILAYDRAIRRLNFSTVITRLSLLLLVLTPSVAILGGVISYDTVTFLFSGLLFLYSAEILNKKKIPYELLLKFSLVLVFGSLFKYTFIALAIPVVAFLVYDIMKNKKSLVAEHTKGNRTKILIGGFLLLIGTGLFIERPVKNYIEYGELSPNCEVIISEERCVANYTQERNITAKKTKPADFEAKSLYEFTFVDWIPNMVRTQVRLNPWDEPVKSLHLLYFCALFSGILMIIYNLSVLMKKQQFVFVIIVICSLSAILLFRNYNSYQGLGQVVATSSRYLLPVQPLFLCLVVLSFSNVFRKQFFLLLPVVVLLLVSMAEGGGVLTYKKQAAKEVYWSQRN